METRVSVRKTVIHEQSWRGIETRNRKLSGNVVQSRDHVIVCAPTSNRQVVAQPIVTIVLDPEDLLIVGQFARTLLPFRDDLP
jgi:hypothetical protein